MLYAAYGSNLNVEQMRYRCPGASIIGTATIPNYRLIFKGSQTGAYCTIEPERGCEVPVGIWSVTDGDIKALNRYEGYPTFYYKKAFNLLCSDGRRHKVFAYIMHENRAFGIPYDGYVRTCLQGYKDFGFDSQVIAEAIQFSIDAAIEKEARCMIKERICPICGCAYSEPAAISREDNHTDICPECGIRQALDIYGCTEEEKEHIIELVRCAKRRAKFRIIREAE